MVDFQMMKDASEIVHYDKKDIPLYIREGHLSDYPNYSAISHWHTDIEIIWPKEAPYKIICSSQAYNVDIDDILLICPAVLHEIFSPSPGSRVFIQADFSLQILNLI